MNSLQFETLKIISDKISLDKFRELHDCITLNKLIRFEIYLKDINKVPDWTNKFSLACSVGNESFQLVKDRGLDNWSSSIQFCSDKESNAMRFVYLHPNAEICDKAKQLNECRNDFDLGLLLGYPKCCVDSYLNWLKVKEDADPITIILDSFQYSEQLVNFDFPNPFSRYFGSGLYSHFPCSLNCTGTGIIANNSFKVLRNNFPETASKLIQMENSLALFSRTMGVTIWNDYRVNEKKIYLNKFSIQSQGKFKSILSTIDEIELTKSKLLLYSSKKKVGDFLAKSSLFATFSRQNEK